LITEWYWQEKLEVSNGLAAANDMQILQLCLSPRSLVFAVLELWYLKLKMNHNWELRTTSCRALFYYVLLPFTFIIGEKNNTLTGAVPVTFQKFCGKANQYWGTESVLEHRSCMSNKRTSGSRCRV